MADCTGRLGTSRDLTIIDLNETDNRLPGLVHGAMSQGSGILRTSASRTGEL